MRKIWKAAVPLVLGAGLAMSALTVAAAPADQFSDIKGHWAQATLSQAYDDGIMKGTSATAMSPNASITKAQAVTLLCRILQVSGQGDTAELQIPDNAWYVQDAAHGVYLGLLSDEDAGTLDQPITRGDAFVLFAKAFQNLHALPGREALDRFPDTVTITGETAFAAENLIDSGVVNGIDGKLEAGKALTRAEFVTMLYRIADVFLPSDQYTGQGEKGAVLSGDGAITDAEGGSLWFDQTVSSIHLTDTRADWVVVRSDLLTDLTLDGAGQVDTLVLSALQGDVDLTIPDGFTLGTLTVGDGGGKVTVSGPLPSLEVIGNHRTVAVNTDVDSLVISGSNNTVVLNNSGESADRIVVTGTGNAVILNGKATQLTVSGRDNTFSGIGQIAQVDLATRYCTMNLSTGKVEPWSNYDLSKVKAVIQAPKTLPAGEHLRAVARLTVPEEDLGKVCTGAWYLNGQKVQEQTVILGQPDPVSDIEVEYNHSLQQEAALRFELTYRNSDGDTFQTQASSSLYLETFEDLGLADASIRLTAPETLSPGQTLRVTAEVTSPEAGKVCTGHWYVDDKEVSQGRVTLGAGTPYLNYDFEYYYGMPKVSQITCKITYTTQDGREQEISGETGVQVENFPDNGIARAQLSLTAPDSLAAGDTLKVTGSVTYLEPGKTCAADWYVDGQKVSSQTVTLGTDTPALSHKFTYTEDMKTTTEIKLVLSYTTQDGRKQEVSAARTVTLQNYGYSHYHGPTDQEILKAVTSTYAGNYTLAWAQSHDYDAETKTRWVNLQWYSSKTQYLIWVNLTYQRVNIFQGSQGNWKLIRCCMCGSGKPSTPTIKGVFATTYKQNSWNYGSYYCGPVVRFYGGYAFHSRLEYWPMGSGRYYDARIGFPISHGCLRMYDDDIWWIYNNIPNGTTVVVH